MIHAFARNNRANPHGTSKPNPRTMSATNEDFEALGEDLVERLLATGFWNRDHFRRGRAEAWLAKHRRQQQRSRDQLTKLGLWAALAALVVPFVVAFVAR